MSWSHFNAEGDVEFKAVLYIPPKAPHDLFENYYSQKAFLKLYVRRVFISEEFDELLPKYLSFLKVSALKEPAGSHNYSGTKDSWVKTLKIPCTGSIVNSLIFWSSGQYDHASHSWIYVFSGHSGLGYTPLECISRNVATTQQLEDHQEEACPQGFGHDPTNCWRGWRWEVRW